MKNKIAINFLIILSFMVLSFAYFVEFILDHEPCNLCKIERLPYIGSIITFCGLVLQLAINVTLIKVLVVTFGCDHLWDILTKELLPIVGTFLGKAFTEITRMLSSSDGIFDRCHSI